MSSEDNETNGRPGDDEEDENEELEEETEDESEEHVSEEIAERGRFRTSERETAETGEDDRLRDWRGRGRLRVGPWENTASWASRLPTAPLLFYRASDRGGCLFFC